MEKEDVFGHIKMITDMINDANYCIELYDETIEKLEEVKKEFENLIHFKFAVTPNDKYNYQEVLQKLTELEERLNENLELRAEAMEDAENLRNTLCYKANQYFKHFNGQIYNIDFLHMLRDKTGLKWQEVGIYTPNNNLVGVAIVSEKDPAYNSKIVAEDISIIENEAKVDSNHSRIVVLTDVSGALYWPKEIDEPVENIANIEFDKQSEVSEAYRNWDWMKLYLYATTGFYSNEHMKVHYSKFLDKNRDLTKSICDMIYSELTGESINRVDEEEEIEE